MAKQEQRLLDFPVFIVGSPRSGTSILAKALLSAGYSGSHEGNLLSLLHTIERNIDNHFRIFGTEDPAVLTAHMTAPLIKAGLFGILRELVDAHYAGQAWFDKTGNPEMIEAIPILLSLWPNARFVFAKRRAIENIVSRLRKFPSLNFEYHCADWARNMSTWRRITQNNPKIKYIEIDQHDLGQVPEGAAAALATFLELPISIQMKMEAMFRRDRPQETEHGTATRILTFESAGWSAEQQQIFRRHCDEQMAAYGYLGDQKYREHSTHAMKLFGLVSK
jgi:hypothetical protein